MLAFSLLKCLLLELVFRSLDAAKRFFIYGYYHLTRKVLQTILNKHVSSPQPVQNQLSVIPHQRDDEHCLVSLVGQLHHDIRKMKRQDFLTVYLPDSSIGWPTRTVPAIAHENEFSGVWPETIIAVAREQFLWVATGTIPWYCKTVQQWPRDI
ncbi:hypothetical protein AVEN_90975-1 [Araneus ventricosus]|uniref:Uncharacterized protein n=1 Tax=Araneus ventricosus TaxID=182803 RepID=A0A4Y2TNT3_ARAVE|nr:hypothetical protein AVEN_90975-1 [Araneus ventricosus]